MAYTPASVVSTSSGLAHGVRAYYNRKALENIYANTIFDRPCTEFTLPKNNGKVVEMFRYNLLGAVSTTPTAAEGTVGSAQFTPASKTLLCSVAQYDDFISTSDFNIATAIDDVLENYARLLGIQAGLTVDTIIRGVFDGDAGSTSITLTGASFNRKDLGLFRAKLSGTNVAPNPIGRGAYYVICHPNITYDLTNDPNAGGYLDVTKTAAPDMAVMRKLEHQGYIGTINGCSVFESTNVYVSGATNRVYAFGKDCAGIVKLSGMGPTTQADPANFRVNLIKGNPNGTIQDPTGVIGGVVSYKFYFGVCLLGGPTQIGDVYRYKVADPTTTVT
jgi:N4-gp56 family major capsid protein